MSCMTVIREKLGEKLSVTASAQDADGNAISLDETYDAYLSVCKDKVGGDEVFNSTMTISGGTATVEIDTNLSTFSEGVFYFDVLIIDSESDRDWTDSIQLILEPRNTKVPTA